MFSLLVEYGLIHRGDCVNCETCYFCFDPAFVWPSLGRADFHSFAQIVNPFRVFVRVPELAGDARQWWQLGLRSLSLFTNRAARSAACILDALPASVRRLTLFTTGYALLVSNSNML